MGIVNGRSLKVMPTLLQNHLTRNHPPIPILHTIIYPNYNQPLTLTHNLTHNPTLNTMTIVMIQKLVPIITSIQCQINMKNHKSPVDSSKVGIANMASRVLGAISPTQRYVQNSLTTVPSNLMGVTWGKTVVTSTQACVSVHFVKESVFLKRANSTISREQGGTHLKPPTRSQILVSKHNYRNKITITTIILQMILLHLAISFIRMVIIF